MRSAKKRLRRIAVPRISWEVGDFFESANGNPRATSAKAYGVVTSIENECILVSGGGGRMGRIIESTFIPDNAVPSDLRGADFAVRMSLVAITVVLGDHSKVRVI